MRAIAFILICGGLLGSAEAACGGGGWKKSPTVQTEAAATPTTAKAPATSVKQNAPAAELVSVVAANGTNGTNEANGTDDVTRHLTPAQLREAEKIQREVRTQYAQLEQDVAHAKALADTCHGDCSVELTRYRTLSAQLKSFSIPVEFKTRLYTALGICEVPRREAVAAQ